MRFWLWWILGITLAAVFNLYSNARAIPHRRRQERRLLEVHGMLVILVEKDPELRKELLKKSIEAREAAE
jgi:hypothetical protein